MTFLSLSCFISLPLATTLLAISALLTTDGGSYLPHHKQAVLAMHVLHTATMTLQKLLWATPQNGLGRLKV